LIATKPESLERELERREEKKVGRERRTMAPPEERFPISELEQRIRTTTKNLKEKSRKLPRDFDLKRDCELFELVQYSCTTVDQMYEQRMRDPTAPVRSECFPFVRLFRRLVLA
jgi:hypothetical protein